jgi:hypothetical protein
MARRFVSSTPAAKSLGVGKDGKPLTKAAIKAGIAKTRVATAARNAASAAAGTAAYNKIFGKQALAAGKAKVASRRIRDSQSLKKANKTAVGKRRVTFLGDKRGGAARAKAAAGVLAASRGGGAGLVLKLSGSKGG